MPINYYPPEEKNKIISWINEAIVGVIKAGTTTEQKKIDLVELERSKKA